MINKTDSQMGITPHGGALVDRILTGEARDAALERAGHLRTIPLNPVAVSDMEMIAVGAFSPLKGFMGKADYESVVETMRLAGGVAWPIPVTLPVSSEVAHSLRDGEDLALTDAGGQVLGILELTERFTYDKQREARLVYRTTEEAHPGVARLYAQGEALLAGPIWLLNRP
ncbi:MAG: sulfate adenylyltransferase, partial [Chloroflexi bacterium]|nr:sulfate adenylyltransferase [Chloroflexota bacterium]